MRIILHMLTASVFFLIEVAAAIIALVGIFGFIVWLARLLSRFFS